MSFFDPGLFAFRVVILLLGAAVGSFLAAAAWRLPREKSLFEPSRCVSCGTKIPYYALAPVLGWFFTRGRCGACGAKVSLRYPLVEALTGILTLVAFEVHGPSSYVFAHLAGMLGHPGLGPIGYLRHDYIWGLSITLWLLYTGVLLSLIDLEFRILPDVVTLPGTLVGLLVAWSDPDRGWFFSVVGIASGAGSLWLIASGYRWLRGRDGMGMGDVKYIGMIGAVLGWSGVLWTMLLASVLGSIVGIGIGLAATLWGKGTESGSHSQSALSVAIPFGPFLALGAIVYSLFDKELISFMTIGP
jgi:leader peptidase (prepilin peptidase)/N-methyltransferase